MAERIRSRRAWRSVVLVCTLFCLPTDLRAQQEGGIERGTKSSSLSGTLENGMRYRVHSSIDAKEPISVQLTVRAGSFDEDPDQREVAHLIEHVAALHGNGDINSIPKLLERNGLSLGNGYQAATEHDVTTYRFDFDAGKPDLLVASLRVLRTIAADVKLDAAAVDRERLAVLGERRAGTSPETLAADFVRSKITGSACFPEDFNRRTEENVAKVPLAVVRRFYEDWYHPGNQMISVSGAVDGKRTVALIEHMFGNMAARDHVRRRSSVNACAAVFGRKPQVVRADYPGLADISLGVAMSRSTATREGRSAKDDLIEAIAEEILSQRSYQMNRHYLAPYWDFNATLNCDSAIEMYGALAAGAQVKVRRPEDVEPALRVIVAFINDLRTHGPTQAELNAARLSIKARSPASTSWTKEQLADLSPAALLQYFSGVFNFDRDMAIILQVPTDVVPMLPRDNRLLTTISSRAKRLTRASSSAQVPQVVMSAAIGSALPAHDFVEEPVVLSNGVTDMTLANGIRVLVHSSETSTGEIRITGLQEGGLHGYDPAIRASAAALGGVSKNTGAGMYDKFQIADFERSNGLTLNYGILEDAVRIEGFSPPDRLEQLLQLIALSLGRPRWNQIAFEDWQQTSDKSRDLAERDGSRELAEIRARHFGSIPPDALFGENPASLQQIRSIFDDRFGKMGNFIFVVSGPSSMKNSIPVLNRYLGSLPAGRSVVRKGERANAIAARESHVIQKGFEREAQVSITIPTALPESLQGRLVLEIVGAALRIRIVERIRGDEGASYSPMASVGLLGDFGSRQQAAFSISFACAPANAPAMKVAALEEVRKLATAGLDEDMLTRAKGALLSNGAVNRLGPQSWHDFLLAHLSRPDVEFDPSYRERGLSKIGLNDVNAVIEKSLNLENALEVIQLPGQL